MVIAENQYGIIAPNTRKAKIVGFKFGVDRIIFGQSMDINVVDQRSKTLIYGDGELLTTLSRVKGKMQYLETDSSVFL